MLALIVDDEGHIVEYLKHLLDWKALGLDCLLTTSSATQAKEWLETEKPDLMITDIRMPEISGLQLAEFVSTSRLPTKTLILSGYSDFQYAQKAIQYGVVDYIVKPVERIDLEQAVKKALLSIEKEQSYRMHSTFQKLDGLRTMLSLLNTKGLVIDNFHAIVSEFSRLGYQAVWRLNSREKFQILVANRYFLLTNQDLSDSTFPIIKEQNRFTAQQAFYQPLSKGVGEITDEFWEQLLKETDAERWSKIVDLLKEWQASMGKSPLNWQVVINFCTWYALKLQPEGIIPLTSLFANKAPNGEELLAPIIKMLEEKCNEGQESSGVSFIKQFVQEHYGEDLSLELLGSQVHLHPVYLSRLFKQETGETLLNYITIVRLEKAAELLKVTNLKVHDICGLVGYHKPNYFIQIFKKHLGETPQQYRKNAGGQTI